jgi:hypothetical protein
VASQTPDVLETDGGRSPFWGIAAGVVLVAFIALALWRATANDGSTSSTSYSSQAVATSLSLSGGTAAAGSTTPAASHKSTTATTVFFFGLFGAMALVGVGIAWRTQHVNHTRRA